MVVAVFGLTEARSRWEPYPRPVQSGWVHFYRNPADGAWWTVLVVGNRTVLLFDSGLRGWRWTVVPGDGT
jgi:hypothetical protein